MTTRRLPSSLGPRLIVAFVGVATAALVVFALLLLAATRTEVDELVTLQHETDAVAVAAAAAEAYVAAGGWENAELTAAAAIAARGQASLLVSDAQGEVVAAATAEAARLMAEMHGVDVVDVPRSDPITHTVLVDDEAVGAVHLAYPVALLPADARHVRDSFTRIVLLGGFVSTLVAVAVAVFVAGRVTRPLVRLTEAASAVAAGKRDVRVGSDAPGELGQLATAFDTMAAAVQEQDELRRRQVADVAHELRTPLTILRGTTEALVDGVLPSDATALATLHQEVLRLSGLVADLETLAAADAGGLTLVRKAVDLADISDAVVALARPTAADAGVQLETQLEHAPANGDARRLTQVMTNLISNALAYTPRGGTVTVSTGVHDGRAVVEVSDTGPGLAPGEEQHVFERFYRGAAAAETSGSGIGLAVASEIVAAHAGTLTAADRTDGGGGARFTVTLPSV